MANNYLQFSFMVTNVTDEGEIYIDSLFKEYAEREDMEPCEFESEVNSAGENQVWFYAEEWGDPDGISRILGKYLDKFDPKKVISFTWAATCSKLRLDEFTGGGVIISAKEIKFMSVDQWISRTLVEV